MTTQDMTGQPPTGPGPDRPHKTVGADEGVVARTEQGGGPDGVERPDGVVAWIGYHFGELVAVGVPGVLAVTWHPVWTVPTVAVAAGWITHEIRVARGKTSQDTSRAGAPGRGDAVVRAAGSPVDGAAVDGVVVTGDPAGPGQEVRRGLA